MFAVASEKYISVGPAGVGDAILLKWEAKRLRRQSRSLCDKVNPSLAQVGVVTIAIIGVRHPHPTQARGVHDNDVVKTFAQDRSD